MYNEEYLELELVGELKVLEQDRIDFLEKIISHIEKADSVFVYRAYLHNDEQNKTISEIKEQASMTCDVIDINFTFYDKTEIIIADNDEKIYCMKLNNDNRKDFIDNFKLSNNPLYNLDIEYNKSDKILISDNKFEEYNYIFVKDNIVIMMIDSHTLEILVCN